MIRPFAWLTLALLLCLPLRAEEIVGSLSRDQVNITATFEGSEILIYGAVKRSRPTPEDSPMNVVITVQGPREPVTVRRKDRRVGIWVNTDALEIAQAPSFYAVASSAPLGDALRRADDLLHRITIPLAIRLPNIDLPEEQKEGFKDAYIRIQTGRDLFQHLEGTVNLIDDTLFSTSIALPANLVEGAYTTKIYLTRSGRIIDEHTNVIEVKKVGLERWIYNLAHERPLIYGILSLVSAIAAGWLASSFFRYLRF